MTENDAVERLLVLNPPKDPRRWSPEEAQEFVDLTLSLLLGFTHLETRAWHPADCAENRELLAGIIAGDERGLAESAACLEGSTPCWKRRLLDKCDCAIESANSTAAIALFKSIQAAWNTPPGRLARRVSRRRF